MEPCKERALYGDKGRKLMFRRLEILGYPGYSDTLDMRSQVLYHFFPQTIHCSACFGVLD